jgi:hypothetical protein
MPETRANPGHVGIDAPDSRPALGWVLGLPPDWTTTNERLVLLVLAADSYDGCTCSPTRDAIRRASGLWADAVHKAIRGLSEPRQLTSGERPALLQVTRGTSGRGRRTVYRFMVGETRPRTPSETSDGVESITVGDAVGDTVGDAVGDTVGEFRRHPSSPFPSEEEERRRVIRALIPSSWSGVAVLCDDPRLQGVLTDLLEDGWTPELLRQVCSTLPRPRKSPTGLLAKHLAQLREHAPAAAADVSAPVAAAVCPHDVPLRSHCRDCADEGNVANRSLQEVSSW